MKRLKLFLLIAAFSFLQINNSNAQTESRQNKEATFIKQIGSSGFADIIEDLLKRKWKSRVVRNVF